MCFGGIFMNCPECTRSLPAGARFCAFCGTPVRICPSCSAVWRGDALFCGLCGHGVAEPSHTEPEPEDDPITEMGLRLTDDEDDDEHEADSLDVDAVGFLFEPTLPDVRYALRVGELTIGAGDKNDIILARPAVSWNHALLRVRASRVQLQDSASTNGTYVNDVRIQRPQDVAHGDVIRFGNIELKVWLRPQIRE